MKEKTSYFSKVTQIPIIKVLHLSFACNVDGKEFPFMFKGVCEGARKNSFLNKCPLPYLYGVQIMKYLKQQFPILCFENAEIFQNSCGHSD